MASSRDFDTVTLLGLGIAMVDGHALADVKRYLPAPTTLGMARARLNSVEKHPAQSAPHLVHVGWVSKSGHLYSDAQHEDLSHVSMVPVYRLLTEG